MTAAQQRAIESLLPRFEIEDSILPIDLSTTFPDKAPFYLEIGVGNGICVLNCAEGNPDNNYLGVEVHRPGVGYLLNQAQTAGVSNLRVCIQDVQQVLARLPAECLTVVYIFFPDPWPKKRHHKRRLVRAALLSALQRTLHRHGRVYIATDSSDYATDIQAELVGQPCWLNLAGPDTFASRPKARIRTRFEARAIQDGRTVYEFVLAKAMTGVPRD